MQCIYKTRENDWCLRVPQVKQDDALSFGCLPLISLFTITNKIHHQQKKNFSSYEYAQKACQCQKTDYLPYRLI